LPPYPDPQTEAFSRLKIPHSLNLDIVKTRGRL
jgi:hypothetical protein